MNTNQNIYALYQGEHNLTEREIADYELREEKCNWREKYTSV